MCDDIKREIRADLKEFKESFDRDMRKDIRDIKASLNLINKLYEELKEEINVVRTENKNLMIENTKLQAPCDELTKQVKEYFSRLLRTEHSRNVNLEIRNVPYQADENLHKVVEKIGETIGKPISANDIEICHPVPVANITVNKNTHRDEWNRVLERPRRTRLNCTDVGFVSQAAFYINEHFCSEMKRNLGRATTKKRETGWKFVWVRNGQITAKNDLAKSLDRQSD